MRKTLFLSTALGAMALLGAPAFAESGTHSSVPLPMQQHAARQADDMSSGRREASSLLHQADQAAARGQWGRANELLERAQTARLNEHALTGSASSGDMRAFEEARQAISSRDRRGAHSALQSAMSDGRGGWAGNSATGSSDFDRAPMQGGGGMMGHDMMGSGGSGNIGSNSMGSTNSLGSGGTSGYGSSSTRGSGMGGSSMSRADIILAQGSTGEGSGGLQGNTPGSPGTGSRGSVPNALPGTAVSPPQSSALPGSMSSTTGPGAPSPGTLTPAPGTTSAGPRTTTGSSGANPPTSGSTGR